jgi:hypothetical protein
VCVLLVRSQAADSAVLFWLRKRVAGMLVLSLLAVALAVGAPRFKSESESQECVFRCPGNRPVKSPRASHEPSFNGCGSGGFKIDASHWPGMEQCCNDHDMCYDTCGKHRSACDDQFGACLDARCGRNQECSSTASMLKMGSSMLGCQFYLDSQRQACECKASSRDDL